MKKLFNVLLIIIKAIAFIVFVSGTVFVILGIYDFFHAFTYLGDENKAGIIGFIAIGLLRSVDLFLVAIVLFVFSLGLLVLFLSKDEAAFPAKLPTWLKVNDFIGTEGAFMGGNSYNTCRILPYRACRKTPQRWSINGARPHHSGSNFTYRDQFVFIEKGEGAWGLKLWLALPFTFHSR